MHQQRDKLQRIFLSFYPSHTQNVKRQIRIVSQLSINIVTPELRDARINITPLLMPQFTSKRDFIVYNIYSIFHCFYILHNKNYFKNH